MVIAFLKWNPAHHRINDNPLNIGGEYNGYVAFDAELPISYQGSMNWQEDNVLDNLVTVHGGITFDRPMSDLMEEPIIPITAIPEPKVLKTFRVVGFDTLHYGDTKNNWTFEATKQETLELMKQIEDLCSR